MNTPAQKVENGPQSTDTLKPGESDVNSALNVPQDLLQKSKTELPEMPQKAVAITSKKASHDETSVKTGVGAASKARSKKLEKAIATQVNEDPEELLKILDSDEPKAKPARMPASQASEDQEIKSKPDFFRETKSRVFAYLNSGTGSSIKIDLLFDKSPQAVRAFIRHVLNCSSKSGARGTECANRVIGLDPDTIAEMSAASKADPERGIASVSTPSGYHGFVCAYPSTGPNQYTIALNIKEDVPEDCQIIGGILDAGDLDFRLQNEQSHLISYPYADASLVPQIRDNVASPKARYREVFSLVSQ